ncbi:MAG: cobalamin-independent methionine synthase II family protein [Alphaproteobacteria bacterium]|jgi:5-methyltetrahydropteroyltriglutamate--homocysteine methyltransferase|nr:cobalamin-independent methionine synthase II family protein [Alphaproteobacteria bacterium]
MALLTTTIGAYPKPDYVPISDWFCGPDGPDTAEPTKLYAAEMTRAGADAEALFRRATEEVIGDQIAVGIDIPTDGEVRRENYIHYHCRHLDGIDFDVITERRMRGVYAAHVPTITGPVGASTPFLAAEWKLAQELSDKPVKATLPGPMTIANSISDAYYEDAATRGRDLAAALNAEVRSLAEAGCRHVQIDEPVFARQPDRALDFGLADLERCFAGVGGEVTRTVHICCGYPSGLDIPDYPKAPKTSYLDLAEALDQSEIDAVSLEDAHRHNDLATLLARFRDTIVALGCVDVTRSAIEPAAEIAGRLREALGHIEAERLWVAPDCGLGLLGRELAMAKLRNMCMAAATVA